MYSNGKNTAHSGEGRLVGNIISLIVFVVIFAAGLYALSFWTLENAWLPTILCFAATIIAFGVPMHIMGRGDKADALAAAAELELSNNK